PPVHALTGQLVSGDADDRAHAVDVDRLRRLQVVGTFVELQHRTSVELQLSTHGERDGDLPLAGHRRLHGDRVRNGVRRVQRSAYVSLLSGRPDRGPGRPGPQEGD